VSDELNLRDLLASLGEGIREPFRTLANGLADLRSSPEVAVLRHALKAAQVAGAATGLVNRREAAEALAQLKSLADRLRREGIDPALGVASLLGDCLDGLEVLVSTETVPMPVELEELRLALARLRRPETRLDLVLPAEGARSGLAGRLVRALVEDGAVLGESLTWLSDLERAVAEAVAGAIRRTQAYDPTQPVGVHARLRGDLLRLEVVDRGSDEAQAARADATGADAAGPEWDLPLVRRVMDQVSYERAEREGILRLTKRLRSWS